MGCADPDRSSGRNTPIGPLLENFAIGEVARQLTWAEEPVQLFRCRDRDQAEVDMVLEHAAGTVIGIEVKAAETVRAEVLPRPAPPVEPARRFLPDAHAAFSPKTADPRRA